MESVPIWIDYGVFAISIFMAIIAIAATLISYNVYAANTSPDVIVHLEPNPDAKSVFNLIIENIGRGAAKDVVFSPASPLPQEAFGIENAPMPSEMDHGPILTGIPYLAPGSSRTIMLGQFSGLEQWLGDKSLVINIQCKRANPIFGVSKTVCTSSSIDIFSYAAVEMADNSHAKKIKDELKKLNSNISTLISVIHARKVD